MSDRQIYKKLNYITTDYIVAADTEQDSYSLYSLSDDRVWTSGIKDINGGDNFADYCKEFFAMLDEEEYYDN